MQHGTHCTVSHMIHNLDENTSNFDRIVDIGNIRRVYAISRYYGTLQFSLSRTHPSPLRTDCPVEQLGETGSEYLGK